MEIINKIKFYLKELLELSFLLLGVLIFVEILFAKNGALFGSQVTANLASFLSNIGDSGIAALIAVFALIYVFRRRNCCASRNDCLRFKSGDNKK